MHLKVRIFRYMGMELNVRDWIYVEDHCSALELLLTMGDIGEVYNIGGWETHTNLEMIESICNILNQVCPVSYKKYSELITTVSDRPGHDFRYAINPSKIKNVVGWWAATPLNLGLEYTVQWYLDNPEWIQHIQNGAYLEWINTNYAWRTSEN